MLYLVVRRMSEILNLQYHWTIRIHS